MKRGLIALALVLLSTPVLAQIRGVPPSVTSMAPWRSFTPGVPASVTSLGPNGFGGPCSTPGALISSALGCNDPAFTTFGLQTFPNNRLNLHPRHRGFFPVYVPYTYPVYPGIVDQQPETQPVDVEDESEPPARTIYERRSRTAPPPVTEPKDESRYGTHYLDTREHPAVPTAEASQKPDVRDEVPIVLIYRDGHQREVKNYAIVGNTLYDLGTFVAQKIPLAELDLKATLKANEDRGVEFSLPASVTP